MKLIIATEEELLWQGQSNSKIQANPFSTAKKILTILYFFYKDKMIFLELETAQTVACFSDNKKSFTLAQQLWRYKNEAILN